MMGKPKKLEEPPVVTVGENDHEDTIPDPLQMEANISKAKAEAAKMAKEAEKAEG